MRLPLFGNMSLGSGLLVGVGAVLLVPVVLPVVATAIKPLAKAAIKGGILLYDKGKVAVAELQETVEDLVAEAKAEMAKQPVSEELPQA
jgi:hypothetical protein